MPNKGSYSSASKIVAMIAVVVFFTSFTVKTQETTTISDEYVIINQTIIGNDSNWSPWENCIVNRQRYRTCLNGTCLNNDGMEYFSNDTNATTEFTYDTLNFTLCPILTTDQIVVVVVARKAATVQKLQQITNNTQRTIEAIQVKYSAAITSSTSFGYVAAICIVAVFSLPVLSDLHTFILYQLNKKTMSNQVADQKNPKPKKASIKVKKLKKTIQSKLRVSSAVAPLHVDNPNESEI